VTTRKVLAQPDGEGDIVVVEEFQPVGADELPVGQELADGRGGKMGEIALDQRDADRGRAVAAARQQGPDERHPEVARHHGEHQIVHLPRPDRPLRPVEHQGPAAARPEQPRDQRQRPVLAEADVLEEPLQPAVGRRRERSPRPLAGDVAEVHRASADHADDQQAECLPAGLAQPDVRAQKAFEGGDGTVRQRTILWRESSRKSPHPALSQPCVV
jgi:hypothetical protein